MTEKEKRTEKLFSALTDIDDRFVEEATGKMINDELNDETVNDGMVTVHPGRNRKVAIAACFVILVALVFPLLKGIMPKAVGKSNETDAVINGESLNDKNYLSQEKDTSSDKSVSGNTENEVGTGPSEENNSEMACVISSAAPSSVKIGYSTPGDLTFEVVDYDFALAEPFVKVRFTNNTDEDRYLYPQFNLMRVTDDGKYESIVKEGMTRSWPSVLFTVTKNGGTYDMAYTLTRFENGGYDYLHTGRYALFLNSESKSDYIVILDLTFDR